MQIKKQEVNVGKAIFEGEIKSGAEGSIIVPDVKPDILKILQVDADTFLDEKTIDNGKLILKGKVYVNVLYIPEADGECVQCIKGCFEFCETVKRAEFEQGMDVKALCDARKVGYKLINSRKIGIDAHIGINVCVTSNELVSFICDIENESSQIKKEKIQFKNSEGLNDFIFKIDENIDLAYPDAKEILKSNVTIEEKDYRAITGKVVLKGKVSVSVLYVTQKASYEHIDFVLPFTEVFDNENIDEDSECEIIYEVLDTDFKIIDSVNDNKKSISAYIEVKAQITKENNVITEYIKDCYFTDSDCLFNYEKIECENILAKPMFSAVLKQIIEKNDNLPDISGIYTSIAKPIITSIDVQNGRISVSGRVTVYVLYTSDNTHCPLSSLSEEIPFSYMIDCEKASREAEVLLNIECEHISCTINSANSVEIRCGLGISGKIVHKEIVNVINEISVSEVEKREKALMIYFVKSGDTLWNIGKKYHVKYQDICDCNQIDCTDELVVGQKLIIPVSK